MPGLWLLAGLIYMLAGIGIYLDHTLRFSQQWNWDEFLHHEAFFVMTVWVGAAYLTVALVEYTRRKKTNNKVAMK